MAPDRKFWLRKAPAVIALAVAALCGWQRMAALGSSPYPPGADGYYYAAQVRHMRERGQFFGAEHSLALPLLYLSSIAQDDLLRSTQRAAGLFAALLILSSYLAARSFFGRTLAPSDLAQRDWLALLASLWTAFASAGLFLSYEYWKQLLGAVFLLLYLAALFSSFSFRLPLAVLMAVLAWSSHRSTAPFLLASFLPSLATANWAMLRYRWADLIPRGKQVVLVLVATGLAGLLVLGVLAIAREQTRILHGLGSGWPPAALQYVRVTRGGRLISVEALLTLAAAPAAIACFTIEEFRSRIARYWPSGSLLFALLLAQAPFLRFEQLDLGFRLYLLAFLFAAPLLALCLAGFKLRAVLALATLTGIAAVYQTRDFVLPTNLRPESMEAAIAAIDLPEQTLLIAQQPLDNIYFLRQGKDSYRYEPGARFGNRPLVRLLHGIDAPLYSACLKQVQAQPLPARYWLLPELQYQRFFSCLQPASRTALQRNARNVSALPPGFLR